jgi:phage gp36-like protein
MTTLPASYATVPDVLMRYPPVGSVSAISSAHAALAIGHVQAEIETVLAGRYGIPFNPVPPIIATITADLACLRLIETRIIVNLAQSQLSPEQSKSWTEQLRHSGKLLEGLASGSYALLSGSGTILPSTGTAIEAEAAAKGEVWHMPVGPPAYIGQPWMDVDPKLRPTYGEYGHLTYRPPYGKGW